MTFAEQIQQDVTNIFLNTEEFAESRTVNGEVIAVHIATVETPEGERWQGQARALLSVTMAMDALPTVPQVGETMTIDGVDYPVVGVRGRYLLKVIVEDIGNTPTQTATVVHYSNDGWNEPTETEREENIPCRYLTAEELRTVDGGVLARGKAVVVFAADSGLAGLAIGDRVIIGATTYRVIGVHEERDAGGRLTRRLASVDLFATDSGYYGY